MPEMFESRGEIAKVQDPRNQVRGLLSRGRWLKFLFPLAHCGELILCYLRARKSLSFSF